MKFFTFSILLLFITSCIEAEDFSVQGMAPIYLSYGDFSQIKLLPSQPFVKAGKIVTLNQFVYINEFGRGVHVIDNSDPLMTINLGFINIPGNTTFTIIKNIMYADNGRHLLLVDISDLKNVKYISHIKDQYINNENFESFDDYPLNYKGWFECYDLRKGILIGWESKTLVNPACETRN